MPHLYWDVEARSASSLPTCGAWRYAADPSTDVVCVCYAVEDGAVEVWLPGQLAPVPFLAAATNPLAWRTIAHNAEFEHAMLERILVPKHEFLPIPLEAQHCSMTLALANAHPAELDLLSAARDAQLPVRRLKGRPG